MMAAKGSHIKDPRLMHDVELAGEKARVRECIEKGNMAGADVRGYLQRMEEETDRRNKIRGVQ